MKCSDVNSQDLIEIVTGHPNQPFDFLLFGYLKQEVFESNPSLRFIIWRIELNCMAPILNPILYPAFVLGIKNYIQKWECEMFKSMY